MVSQIVIPSIFTAFFLLFISISASPNPLDALIGKPMTSHSGPTNALWGHEQLVDEDPMDLQEDHDRSKRGVTWRWRWTNPPQQQQWQQQQPQQQQQQYSWPTLISSEPPNEYLKMWLTAEHNRYRQMVPATNMRMLYWSEELAASAQRHADRCDFRHSRDRVNVGENIWASPYSNYSDAISLWFNEVNNPWCGCNHAYKHCCGHYIQVVWAQTALVGCGFSRCSGVWGLYGGYHRNVFVCHYNPQGNTVYVTGNGLYAVPAFHWATQQQPRCSECPSDAPACWEGLCYMPENYTNGTTSVNSGSSSTSTSTALPDETRRPIDHNRVDEMGTSDDQNGQSGNSINHQNTQAVQDPWQQRRSEQELRVRRRL